MLAPQERGTHSRTFYFSDNMNETLSLLIYLFSLQKARVEELQRAYRRAEASHPRENAPKAGTIRSLGLLNKDEDTKAVIGVDRSLDGRKVR